MTLPPRARAALIALCDRIGPGGGDGAAAELAAAVEQRILTLDPRLRRDLLGAINFFDHPLTGVLLSGRPRRFSTLPAAEQDALLREWEGSGLALRRSVFQAIRRLILTTYWAAPATHASIGLLPPLHRREPAFPWEGPAGGDAAPEDGPIARRGAPRQAPGPWPEGITSATSLPPDTRITADVCVVGSGAGGAVAAARLAEAGHEVVVLEEGGFYTGTDFDDDESRLGPLLYAEAAARATDDVSMILLQGSCVGGGTTVNWMMTLRPMPWVMREWEEQHGVELLGERSLGPAMDAMEAAIHARPVPDGAHNPPNRVIIDGCARLGWRTLDAKINADGCVRAGACGLGCRWGAKRSAGDVFLPRALRAGARLLTHARAERIDVAERGGAAPLKHVHAAVVDPATRQARGSVRIDAPVVVLAAGAVGTPVLLERSGLGGGAVGRWLRLHPTTAVFGVYDRVIYGGAGPPQSSACGEFLYGRDGYGFWLECAPLRPALAAAALQGFGAEHRSLMEGFTRIAPAIVLVRDGADVQRSSGDVRVDRRGRVHIRYRLARRDRRQLVLGLQAAARLHLVMDADHALSLHVGARPVRTDADVAALAAAAYEPNRISLFSAHVNGTCRAGADARAAACSPDAERHDAPGVYVADGSLLPTAPGVNPQLAIMALADRVAERITARHPR